MIRYLGGKTKLAKDIVNQLIRYKKKEHQQYLEPFFGGGSMAKYTQKLNLNRYAFDNNLSLIMMYKDIQNGWLPPKIITEEQYKLAKNLPDCALKGYIGFSCSYGGKWFGGFARDKTGKRNLTKESYDRVIKDKEYIADIVINVGDYKLLSPNYTYLVYCDPPYEGTTEYKTKFDHTEFWNKVRTWVDNGATVLISEFQAPNDFVPIWEKKRKISIHNEITNNEKNDKLFIHRSQEIK